MARPCRPGLEASQRRWDAGRHGASRLVRTSVRAMPEAMAQVGKLELCYETFGDPAAPPMLLVMGLGTPMIGWPDGFCAALADRGFHVVRYDNRDVGRSTHLRGVRPPTVRQLLRRDRTAAAYDLGDMAADGIGLLDALDIRTAHVVG